MSKNFLLYYPVWTANELPIAIAKKYLIEIGSVAMTEQAILLTKSNKRQTSRVGVVVKLPAR